jgi:peroxiredoxin
MLDSVILWVVLLVMALVFSGLFIFAQKRKGPELPAALRAGKPLPDFSATDENGNEVRSSSLKGTPTVVLFVRGNWCPFCSRQVKNLTDYYKRIVDLGAKLIFVTPRPLSTTRRVAEFFEVEFDFWTDTTLRASKSLGLVFPKGVPADYVKEYGEDTIWPTAVIVDSDNIIRYSKISRYVFDRPNPEQLFKELEKVTR